MKDIGNKIKNVEGAYFIIIHMVKNMKVNLKIMKKMDMEFIHFVK